MKHGDETRRRLVDTAMSLIWQRSYGAVPIDDICRAAKVSKSSFYHFFRSKAELTAAAYDHHWDSRVADYDRIFSAQVAPLDRLRAYIGFTIRDLADQADSVGKFTGCPYVLAATELSTQNEEMRIKIGTLFDRITRYFRSAIRDAMDEGSIAPGDPQRLAEDLYTYIIGTLVQAKVRNDAGFMERIEPVAMRLLGVGGAAASAS